MPSDAMIRIIVGIKGVTRWEEVISIMVLVQRNAEIPQIIQTMTLSCRCARTLNSSKEHPDQDSQDSDHDAEFHDRESAASRASHGLESIVFGWLSASRHNVTGNSRTSSPPLKEAVSLITERFVALS
jgi:hypothetical protein